MGYRIPIKYYSKNLAFGEKAVWAYYRMPGFYYDYLSEEKKIQKMLTQSAVFSGMKVEFHLLAVPVEQEMEQISEEYSKQIKGPLREEGVSFVKEVTEELKNKYGSSRKPEFYLGVKMLLYETGKFLDNVKTAASEFKKTLYQFSDLYVVTDQELEQYQRAEKQIHQRLFRYLKTERATETQVQFLIERNFSRGMNKISPEQLKPICKRKDGKRFIESTDVKRLTGGMLDDSPMDYIKFTSSGKTTYMAFLTASYFAHEQEAVGNEFLYHIQELDFPVDLSVRARIKDNESAKKVVKGKKEGLDAEIKFAGESNKEPPQEVLEGSEELSNLEYDLKKSRKPLLETSVVFCVYADSVEKMRTYASLLKESYKNSFEIVLEQPHGDQFLLFNEFLPGAEFYVTDYIHIVEPNFLASGMFGATKELGDIYGFFIGTTGINNRLVYLNPRLAAQGIPGSITNSLSIAIVGSVGGGKSMLVNYLSYNIALAGGKILILDPKGERTKWVEDFPELGEELNIVTLFSEEEYRGLLDPWCILSGKDAEELAVSILTVLVESSTRGTKFRIISKAVKAVGEQKNPCMTAVMEYLLAQEDKACIEVGEDIEAFYDISFAVLLFGNGKPVKTINLESAMNILQVQNLALPDKETKPEDYLIENILSVALLTPITAFAEKFIHGDRSTLKVFVSEEAWATLASSQGKRISNKLSREGRALNSGIYYVSQDVGVLEGAIKDNIGLKFAFRCKDDDEVAAVLKFFNMEYTPENVETLKTLDNGYCLMQDILGHVGVVHIDVLFRDLYHGWDTQPPMEVDA